jgi:deoxyribodipyrimidine photolyase-related protein
MALILLPNQLFKIHNFDNFDDVTHIYIYEHPKFFTDYEYHKTKLVFHRSTMKSYYDYLTKLYKNKDIHYISFDMNIFDKINKKNIYVYDPIDFDILDKFKRSCKRNNINLTVLESKLFILSNSDIDDYIKTTSKPYFNATFYKWMRHKTDILMHNNKPLNNKYSFDTENRLKYPDSYKESNIKEVKNKYINEAITYVNKHFENNKGLISSYLPIDHESSKKYFNNFLKTKLNNFGPYEDAIRNDVVIGYHSCISALLNTGLLDVNTVISDTVSYYKKHNVKIQSVEGFIRQILSWREYIRMLYMKEHDKFNKMNFFKHKRKLNKTWYNGETGILPVDNLIHKANKLSYLHHIERLMVIGNFMLLCEINPKDVFEWFLTFVSIDAYEWVMEPNVYGMSQHSVGQLMMNRPYFSSSNYIMKMSNYKYGDGDDITINKEKYSWGDIWDALYYNFINNNKTYLKKIYSTASSVYALNKKQQSDKTTLFNLANSYLDNYL